MNTTGKQMTRDWEVLLRETRGKLFQAGFAFA